MTVIIIILVVAAIVAASARFIWALIRPIFQLIVHLIAGGYQRLGVSTEGSAIAARATLSF